MKSPSAMSTAGPGLPTSTAVDKAAIYANVAAELDAAYAATAGPSPERKRKQINRIASPGSARAARQAGARTAPFPFLPSNSADNAAAETATWTTPNGMKFSGKE